jgi:hypothetical protein
MIKKTTLLFALLFSNFFLLQAQWTQIGTDINGEATGDRSGNSVSLSTDGSIVAIGAFRNNGNGSDSGHVRVFQNQAGEWIQLGNDIDGESSGDWSGKSVSLNSDGNILAIGANGNDGINGAFSGHVRVFQYDNDDWVQMGEDIDGEAASDESGISVDLSSEGLIVAIGARYNDINDDDDTYERVGHVRVYQYNNGIWEQIGNDIDGDTKNDVFGSSVSLNSDGTIIAIGAPQNDNNGDVSGQIKIFYYDNGTWEQLGNDIYGENTGDYFGKSISINSNGTIVAAGAIYNDGNGNKSGHVRIFQYNGNSWIQMGDDIDGENAEDQSGYSVSLSSNGLLVAIGAIGNSNNMGHVRIYLYEENNWIQVGDDIDGEAQAVYNYAGWSVDLNEDASVVAIGAISNSDNGSSAGQVRIYNNTILTVPSLKTLKISSFPNPSSGMVFIKGKDIIRIEIINTVGKLVKIVENCNTIDLSKIDKGTYFVKIYTDKNIGINRIILK